MCLAWLALSAPAAAEDAITLDWNAPRGCPTKPHVLAETYRLLAGRPSGPRQLRGEAHITRSEEGWSIVLETRVEGATGRRELRHAPSCSEIAEFASLELALAYDPMAVLEANTEAQRTMAEEQAAAASTSAEQARRARMLSALEAARAARTTARANPPPPTTAPSTPDPEPVDDDARFLGGAVAVTVGGDLGARPELGLGFGAMGALRLAWFRIELEGAYWLPQSSYLGAEPGPGGRFDFVSGALLAGPWWRWGEIFAAGPRAGFELGWMRARGLEVDRPEDATLVWMAARLGGRASVTLLDPLAFQVAVGVAIPFDRPRWVLDGLGDLGRPSVVTGRADAGLSLQF